MNDNEDREYAILGGGGVEYSIEDAAVDIDELMQTLQDAKDNGVTHVVMPSGNYRGAQWSTLRAHWDWAEE